VTEVIADCCPPFGEVSLKAELLIDDFNRRIQRIKE